MADGTKYGGGADDVDVLGFESEDLPLVDDAAAKEAEGPGPLGLWAASVSSRARCLATAALLAAVLSLGLAGVTVPLLLSSQGWVPYEAPAGSASQIAKERLDAYFPLLAMASRSQLVIVIRALEGDKDGVLTAAVRDYCLDVEGAMRRDPRTKPLDPIVTGYYVGNARLGVDPEDPVLRSGYVSTDGQMTLLVFMATRMPAPELHWEPFEVRDNVVNFLNEMAQRAPPSVEAVVTGDPAISKDALNDHSIERISAAEMVTFPLAMLVLAVLLGDIRLLVFPPAALAVSLAVACSLTYVVLKCNGMIDTLSSDIPPVMGSVVMALSLDYTLFMLSRFNENRGRAMSLQDNVVHCLKHTGHTVCVSGSLIAIAFFGAYTIPERNLQTAGVALGVTTTACVLVNICFVPSMLLLCGRLLTLPICGEMPSVRFVAVLNRAARATSVSSATRGWFWLANTVALHPQKAIGLVLLLCVPLLVELPQLHATADSYAMLPGDLESIRGLRMVAEGGFPVGRFEPYTVVVSTDLQMHAGEKSADGGSGSSGSAMLTNASFSALLSLARSLEAAGGVASMLGPVWMIDEPVEYTKAHRWLSGDTWEEMSAKERQTSRLYRAVVASHTNSGATLLQIHTSTFPRGAGAADWVAGARKRLLAWAELHPHYTATISGGSTTALDIRGVVMEYMPMYVLYISFGVMTVTILLFRSLVLPFRLVFALLFTLGATFGTAVIVYQSSALHGWNPNLKNYFGICYESLPVATCIGIALGLDYDIFLISRVVEFREKGMTDRSAIVRGVARTGGVITGVGLIMSLAFSGLMFASKLMLQQMGVLLVTSVLLDTFVVRTVMVPALMLAAGEGTNWWPRDMPEPRPALSPRQNCTGEPAAVKPLLERAPLPPEKGEPNAGMPPAALAARSAGEAVADAN